MERIEKELNYYLEKVNAKLPSYKWPSNTGPSNTGPSCRMSDPHPEKRLLAYMNKIRGIWK